MLGQGIMTLFGKPESQKDGELLSHKNHLTLRVQVSFIFKGEGIWLFFINFLVPESFVLAVVNIGLVTIFL